MTKLCLIGWFILYIVWAARLDVPRTPVQVQVQAQIQVIERPAKETPRAVVRGEELPRQIVLVPDYPAIVQAACAEYQVRYELAEAIIWTESRWDPAAYNHSTHDVGLWQFNLYWLPEICRTMDYSAWDPFRPEDNARAGVRYIACWLRYWESRGYAGADLETIAISSFANPYETCHGQVQWWYVCRVRDNRLGW